MVSRSKSRFLCCVLPLCLWGCAEDGKGIEDDELGSYESKEDSFFEPTERGPLVFGSSQPGTLTDDALFHAWDFELIGAADVVLATDSRSNLDTVMYLYRRDDSSGEFGHFLFKNDDVGSSVQSRIAEPLEEGSYRVLVKGFKRNLRGDFTLAGECSGSGCPQINCSGDDIPNPDSSTDKSCGLALSQTLVGEIIAEGSAVVTLEERCTLSAAAQVAINEYFHFWDKLIGFETAFDFGFGVQLEVEWKELSTGGAVVQVNGGGDEATIIYVVSADEKIVAFYHDEQSPLFELGCKGDIFAPEECGWFYIDAMPHDEFSQPQMESAVVTAASAQKAGRVAEEGYRAYAQELGLDPADEVEVSVHSWTDVEFDWDHAGVVTLEAAGEPAHTYEIVIEEARPSIWLVTAARDGGEPELECRKL